MDANLQYAQQLYNEENLDVATHEAAQWMDDFDFNVLPTSNPISSPSSCSSVASASTEPAHKSLVLCAKQLAKANNLCAPDITEADIHMALGNQLRSHKHQRSKFSRHELVLAFFQIKKKEFGVRLSHLSLSPAQVTAALELRAQVQNRSRQAKNRTLQAKNRVTKSARR